MAWTSGLNAAMQTCGDLDPGPAGAPVKRRTWVLAAAAVLVAATATGGVVVASGAEEATPAAQEPPANTVKVEKGELSSMVSLDGTLTYRARSDGSPYSVINRARGTYTQLPEKATRSTAATCSIGWTTTRCCCCAARSRPTATCTEATRARTSVSSTGTCTSSATTPIPATTTSPGGRRKALKKLQHDKGSRGDRSARHR